MVDSIDYVREIRRFRIPLLVINFTALVLSIIYFQFEHANQFESSISFYAVGIKANYIEDPLFDQGGNTQLDKIDKERWLSFSKSNRVKEQLKERLSIQSGGSGVSPEFGYENYDVKINGKQEMVIAVRNSDMEMAYDICKEIMMLTNEMNNDYLLGLNARQGRLCSVRLMILEAEREKLLNQMDSFKLSYSDNIVLDEVIFSLDMVLKQISDGKFTGKENITNYSKLMRLQAKIENINEKVNLIDEEIVDYERFLRNTVVSAEFISEQEPLVIDSRIPSNDYGKFSSYVSWVIGTLLISLGSTISYVLLKFRYKESIDVLLSKN